MPPPSQHPGCYRYPDGSVLVRWGREKGQAKMLGPGTTMQAAAAFRREKLVDVKKGRAPTVPGRKRFAQAVALKRQHHEDKQRRGTLKLTRLAAFFGDDWLDAIDADRIAAFIEQCREDKVSNATINRGLAALRHCLRLAYKRGWLGRVPEIELLPEHNVRECFFTVEECDRLYKLLPPPLAAAAEFSVLTGLRAGNTFGLSFSDIDFGRGELRIAGTKMKNGKPLTIPFAHGSRIEQLLRRQERATKGEGRVFPHRDYRVAWDRAVKKLDKWGEQGGRRVRPVWHDLRHSFAQMMVDAGADEAAILACGGWRTSSMLRRYAITTDLAKLAAADKRDAYLAAERAKPKVIDLKRALGGR